MTFLLASVGVAVMFVWGVRGLPSFGHYPGPYGDEVVQRALTDRHATNAVTTVVMDIRAVDTAGEELILFAAAVGVMLAVPSVLVFLAARYRSFERLHHAPTWEIAQAIAIALFMLVGFVGLAD